MLAHISETQIGIRMTQEERRAIERDAKKSGWSVSQQIRYELFKPRGLWKEIKPYLPGQEAPGRKDRLS